MQDYKKEYINFMLESEVLRFGDFTLKSGRKSPFFMNAGLYKSGYQLKKIGEFYAKSIKENFGLDFDVIFGPAYKGIPLSVATTIALNELYGKEVQFSSNRKEIKDHGDVGIFLGDKLDRKLKVLIIEDVTTSGKSIEETYPIITRNEDVEVIGLIVSLDRMEYGKDNTKTALQEVSELYNFKTASIVNMKEVVEYLKENTEVLTEDNLKNIEKYYQEYGVR
ncbi:orotate phosphoribosyltransferase [Helcococcus kunzii]|uniref:orotate phosphoribosyltransferase n=1 Tax=Helcococcus kunzii TaxID=40091 RepID=UPI001BB0A935|nr:orotate phosphoribosyltransferase [Helcococcus kunzii]MCT1796758.1 orotate phosphoribosyltransferase [Helcococcus kunzii]MCT1988854.1 orotate phosphoribosyltransferase [Helcococcus kunzii]QUY64499.1 orotate phosphoribosyltransferase [Helcococcus kunzii]QZO76912.1 orotate phosphoribosyltransferase [Helcococcus kunzii]